MVSLENPQMQKCQPPTNGGQLSRPFALCWEIAGLSLFSTDEIPWLFPRIQANVFWSFNLLLAKNAFAIKFPTSHFFHISQYFKKSHDFFQTCCHFSRSYQLEHYKFSHLIDAGNDTFGTFWKCVASKQSSKAKCTCPCPLCSFSPRGFYLVGFSCPVGVAITEDWTTGYKLKTINTLGFPFFICWITSPAALSFWKIKKSQVSANASRTWQKLFHMLS